MKNQLVDDYYTKGITGADEDAKDNDINDDDEEDDDENESGNTNLLTDLDDDKYQIDFSQASFPDDQEYQRKFQYQP